MFEVSYGECILLAHTLLYSAIFVLGVALIVAVNITKH